MTARAALLVIATAPILAGGSGISGPRYMEQHESAMAGARRGSSAVAVRCAQGVLLLAAVDGKGAQEPLEDVLEQLPRGMARLDDASCAVGSGWLHDVGAALDAMHEQATSFRRTFGEASRAQFMALSLGRRFYEATLGGSRPFACEVLVASVDELGRPSLFHVDAAGLATCCNALAIGRGAGSANAHLSSALAAGDPAAMTVDEAAALAMAALRAAKGKGGAPGAAGDAEERGAAEPTAEPGAGAGAGGEQPAAYAGLLLSAAGAADGGLRGLRVRRLTQHAAFVSGAAAET